MKNKTNKIMLFSIVSFAIAGLMLSCSSLNQLGLKPKAETEKSTAFQLSGLSISPAEIAARDEVVITAKVTNVTDADGVYNAELRINNATQASDEVMVRAGETQTLTFVVFKDTPGTYKVTLGELTGQFKVAETVATRPDNQTSVALGQANASCCGTGNQTSPALGQASSGCCGTGAQNSPTTQPRRTGGCGCCGR